MTAEIKTSVKRVGASVNAYLVLRQGDRVLLLLRKNTNYCDGMWSFPVGHVEDGELATGGMIREAREEIGVELISDQLTVVHIMHRKTNRMNIDVFFECLSWSGSIRNCEPIKCKKLEFFPVRALPDNTIEYQVFALQEIVRGSFYSEHG